MNATLTRHAALAVALEVAIKRLFEVGRDAVTAGYGV